MFAKRIKAFLYRWRNQPNRKEISRLVKHYEEQTAKIKTGDALALMGEDNLLNLIRISRYADMGEMKVLEFAFSLGYEAGKAGRENA